VIVCGAVPLVGDKETHPASAVSVNERDPEPALVTDSEAAGGLGPPCVALNDKLEGETDKIGCVLVVPEPYAETGPSAYIAPVVQLEGRVLSVVCELVSDADPQPQALSRNLRVPLGPSRAIQYIVPEVIDADGTVIVFQAPLAGELVLPCVKSAPGCDPLFA
jgi:hypothetical protein